MVSKHGGEQLKAVKYCKCKKDETTHQPTAGLWLDIPKIKRATLRQRILPCNIEVTVEVFTRLYMCGDCKGSVTIVVMMP